MKRMLLVAAAVTLSAATAQSAAALAYPSTCPIANPNGYAPWKNCLIDTEARQIPTGSLANTTISLQRPEVGINVSPRVVRFGQKFTVSAVSRSRRASSMTSHRPRRDASTLAVRA